MMKKLLKILSLATLLIAFSFTNVEKKTVIIDVSHGGEDYGSKANGVSEKVVALQIAKKVRELNKNQNLEIILTREEDQFISLEERTEYINNLKPALVISLHANYTIDTTRKGTQIYVSKKSKEVEKSEKLAIDLKNSFKNRTVEIKNANFYILRNVNYPVALLETAFLSNQEDFEILTTQKGQAEIAKNILSIL